VYPFFGSYAKQRKDILFTAIFDVAVPDKMLIKVI